MKEPLPTCPDLGFGLGLRAPHYDQVQEQRPAVGWFEIISENFIAAHRGYWDFLADLRKDYPIIMHGVSLSIGSTDPLDPAYLEKLSALADFLEAPWISDHLCFTGMQGANTHDLLPIPYTEEALRHLIPRIHHVQEAMRRPFVFENASSYLEFDGSTLSEPEFFQELCAATGCGILLDVNNVYVSSYNHGWDAKAYIDAVPAQSIVQYHLAGHTNKGSHIIDTHDAHVVEPVWELFRYAVQQKGRRSAMIEWDGNIPEFSVLLEEMERVRAISSEVERTRKDAA
jgi:uncharacterized protein (UPF0276 family)